MKRPQAPDLSSCDREPITRLDRVQAFGFLLALTNDWLVSRASENLSEFFPRSAGESIGESVEHLIDKEALHEIRNRLAILRPGGSERLYGLPLEAGGPPFDIAVHYADDLLVIEGERASRDDRTDAASLVRTLVGRLQSQTSLEAFHRDAARQIRAITGFDRVMIYRFSDDGAGEVIAESVGAGVESFLGLHYPASDIPPQARALYLRNPFRIIADVEGGVAALLPAEAPPLDLSLSITRAVSPVHLEYLVNMGVSASMSISIIVDGRLWGLFACHHLQPRLPSFTLRSCAELFGQMYAMALENRLRKSTEGAEQDARRLADRMILAIAGDERRLTDTAWMKDAISEVIPSDGVAVYSAGALATHGRVPASSQILELVEYLNSQPASHVFTTDRIATLLPGGVRDGRDVGGMLAIPISRMPRDYLMLFRGEKLRQIAWGGDPEKAVIEDEAGVRLSPRKSFAAFTQLISGRSLPFSDSERRVAEAIRIALIEVVLRLSEEAGAERSRAFERQELLIAELNHRVRNILALIRGLMSQTSSEGVSTVEYVAALGGRVQALARAHDRITLQNWGSAPVSALFEDEFSAFMSDRPDCFTITGPTVLLSPLAFSTLALVSHELVTNSMKYGALSTGGKVNVALDRVEGGLHVRWRESGGPPVTAPLRRGFGSVIIERTVPFDLQGRAEIRYPATGFEADFFVPEACLQDPTDVPPRTGVLREPAPPAGLSAVALERPLEGIDVLLLEDNMIVALEAEDALQAMGARAVWTASTLAQADAICAAETVRFAMLDINIGTGTSLSLANSLLRRGIPLIFASGYGDTANLGAPHDRAPVLRKPYSRDQLRAAVLACIGSPLLST